MGIYDPEEGKPYAVCDCDPPVEFATREEMSAHQTAVREATKRNRSCSAKITNPTRIERIERAISQEASDAAESAASDFTSGLYDILQRGATPAELLEAAKGVWEDIDWRNLVNEYLAEEGVHPEDEDEDSPRVPQPWPYAGTQLDIPKD